MPKDSWATDLKQIVAGRRLLQSITSHLEDARPAGLRELGISRDASKRLGDPVCATP